MLNLIWADVVGYKSISLFQSKTKSKQSLFHKSSNAKRKGNLQLGSAKDTCGPSSLPVTCDCVCTCGDPVPPKPVRRVMFSEDTSSGHCDCESESSQQSLTRPDQQRSLPLSDHHHRSLPSFSNDTPLPALPTKTREAGVSDCGCVDETCDSNDSTLFRSSIRDESPAPNNHYKSPHEVDGEYSYAYR